MNAMSITDLVLAATSIVAAVALVIFLVRTVLRDGYGISRLVDPRRDWGTSSLPSHPYGY